MRQNSQGYDLGLTLGKPHEQFQKEFYFIVLYRQMLLDKQKNGKNRGPKMK